MLKQEAEAGCVAGPPHLQRTHQNPVRGGAGADSLYPGIVPVDVPTPRAYPLARAPCGRERVQRVASSRTTQEYKAQTLTSGKQSGPTREFLSHGAPAYGG